MLKAASEQVAESCSRLELELQNAGLRPLVVETETGRTAGGLPARIDLHRQGQGETTAIIEECGRAVAAGVPVNLNLVGLAGSAAPEEALDRALEHIAAIAGADPVSRGLIGTCLYTHQVSLDAYRLIRHQWLGAGPAYVLLDSLMMWHHGDERVQEQADSDWLRLWRYRCGDAPLLPAYAAPVRTACPLLSDEASAAVLPALGATVPCQSAWLPIELDLRNFSDGRGELQWPVLEQALTACVTLGNDLLDLLSWELPLQAEDALKNRRLAITIGGIGELVAERGSEPRDLECLQWICDDLKQLRTRLWQLSGELASRQGPLPVLQCADPAAPWHDRAHRAHWQSRWRNALRATAVRNRNLLVLSPYAVLPADGRDAASHMDLLPVMKFADAWSFREPASFDGWTAAEFRRFHERAWAVMQRKNGNSFVAAGV